MEKAVGFVGWAAQRSRRSFSAPGFIAETR
jgi:hypothetical protein